MDTLLPYGSSYEGLWKWFSIGPRSTSSFKCSYHEDNFDGQGPWRWKIMHPDGRVYSGDWIDNKCTHR